jgi:hypothetical protein
LSGVCRVWLVGCRWWWPGLVCHGVGCLGQRRCRVFLVRVSCVLVVVLCCGWCVGCLVLFENCIVDASIFF